MGPLLLLAAIATFGNGKTDATVPFPRSLWVDENAWQWARTVEETAVEPEVVAEMSQSERSRLHREYALNGSVRSYHRVVPIDPEKSAWRKVPVNPLKPLWPAIGDRLPDGLRDAVIVDVGCLGVRRPEGSDDELRAEFRQQAQRMLREGLRVTEEFGIYNGTLVGGVQAYVCTVNGRRYVMRFDGPDRARLYGSDGNGIYLAIPPFPGPSDEIPSPFGEDSD